jgi:hypothetical protein
MAMFSTALDIGVILIRSPNYHDVIRSVNRDLLVEQIRQTKILPPFETDQRR